MDKAFTITYRLLQSLDVSNDCKFDRKPHHVARLHDGVVDMLAAGLVFTDQVVEDLTDGSEEEQDSYQDIDGYDDVMAALNAIFNGDN